MLGYGGSDTLTVLQFWRLCPDTLTLLRTDTFLGSLCPDTVTVSLMSDRGHSPCVLCFCPFLRLCPLGRANYVRLSGISMHAYVWLMSDKGNGTFNSYAYVLPSLGLPANVAANVRLSSLFFCFSFNCTSEQVTNSIHWITSESDIFIITLNISTQ